MRKSLTIPCLCAGLLMLISVFCFAKTVNREISKNTLKQKTFNISENNNSNSQNQTVLNNAESKFVIKFTPLKRLKAKFNNLNFPGKNKICSVLLSNESKYTDSVYADLSYLKFLRISRMLC